MELVWALIMLIAEGSNAYHEIIIENNCITLSSMNHIGLLWNNVVL